MKIKAGLLSFLVTRTDGAYLGIRVVYGVRIFHNHIIKEKLPLGAPVSMPRQPRQARLPGLVDLSRPSFVSLPPQSPAASSALPH